MRSSAVTSESEISCSVSFITGRNGWTHVRICDLSRLPVVGTDVESKAVDTVGVCEFDIIDPVVDGVREGIADHVMGYDILVCIAGRGSGC